MIVTVESVDNGYVVKFGGDTAVFEGGDTPLEDTLCAARMMYAVLEAVGAYGSKHDDYRVRVAVIERDTGKDMLA